MIGRVRGPLLLAAVCALAGCGGGAAEEARTAVVAPERPVKREPAPERRCRPGARERIGTGRRAFAAVVRVPTRAFRRPGQTPLARFGRLNVNGVPTVFGVLGRVVDGACRARWYRVQLPIKPNGVTGFVPAADVRVVPVRTRIEVDLSERRVTAFRDGRRIMRAAAAIGSSATPTPTGRYYVNQRLIPIDPTGPFGPGAIGISAFSEVLTGWTQGGPIALHGTNQPASVGRPVSNGCLRLRNDVLRRLFRVAFSGTPVVIRP
jgi:lipoprotein-anchoring transpeptidase ErfK/SrfK